MHRVEAFEAIGNVLVKELKLPLRPKLFSYLPLSHIAERMAIEMYGLFNGACISFAESLDSFSKNLEDTQPNLFFAVPRIWGKLREGILKKMPQKKLSMLLTIPVINSIIKKGIKKKLGLSNASHIYSAAAPISVELQEWFQKLGITIFQAYGMSEDCVYSHFDKPGANKFGKVGKPLPGLLTKISDDGEIRVKSVGNMKGYYKEPELTADMFDEEQYLKTGDIGEYDEDGFLTITGRVKDIFKTDKGKYISPAPIEMRLLSSTLIEQACVVGTGVPQPLALVTLSDLGKKMTKQVLENDFATLLKAINNELEKFEKLEKIVVMKENWSILNNQLTPTLKVKRNEVEKIHLPKYPEWYDHKEPVIWE
jgi:long-chain acyl-CoA synthetase